MANRFTNYGDKDESSTVTVSHNLAEQIGGPEKMEALLRNQAVTYGVGLEDLGNPNLRAALMRATMLSLSYGFMPGQHLHLQVSGGQEDLNHARPRSTTVTRKSYAIVIGVHAYMDSFDQWKRENRKMAWVQTAELSSAETIAITKSRYPHVAGDVEDCGATARFLDQEEAIFCQKVGLPYDPPIHYGFWRKRAIERTEGGRKVWEPDMIPNQRAPMDVALLRATKACLMSRVPLQPINQLTLVQRLAQLEDLVAPEMAPSEAELAPIVQRRDELIVEPDGDVLFVRPRPRGPVRDLFHSGESMSPDFY